MTFFEATQTYEDWLRTQVPVIEADLAHKHRKMAGSSHTFLRATFYWWVPTWHAVCADLATAPKVLGIGDIHVENFGTWRDIEGRLAWGVNDFDEAAQMPYTMDLVRLGASAILARKDRKLRAPADVACAAILRGYQQQLKSGAQPFVLEEQHLVLRAGALTTERDPVKYWDKLQKFKTVTPPASVRRMLKAKLPKGSESIRFIHRVAGGGSLGRPRYVALATLKGANVAREAKAMVPSAYGWSLGRVHRQLLCDKIHQAAIRSHDPYMHMNGTWLVRRLGPRCSSIDLDLLPHSGDEIYFLEAMGREVANVHAGSGSNAHIQRHLSKLKRTWLRRAAGEMADAMINDWQNWKRGFKDE